MGYNPPGQASNMVGTLIKRHGNIAIWLYVLLQLNPITFRLTNRSNLLGGPKKTWSDWVKEVVTNPAGP